MCWLLEMCARVSMVMLQWLWQRPHHAVQMRSDCQRQLALCCTALPEFNKPLAAALYFSKELSRHGKGAAALLYFGNKVRQEVEG